MRAKSRSETAESKPAKYQVPSLRRALAILDTLGESSFGLTVREISQAHDLPYSTAFYLLETMREGGYVERSEETKKYALGHRIMTLRNGRASRSLHQLRTVGRPILEELTQLTELTGHLAVLERNEAIYVEKSEPSRFVRLNTWIGKRNPLHSTAVGKALLMGLPEARRRDIVAGYNFVRRTERTISEPQELLESLAASAERGFAVDDGEDERQGRCVAAPIFGSQGEVTAAIGLSGTLSQAPAHKIDTIGRVVRDAAARISRRLGYEPETTDIVSVERSRA